MFESPQARDAKPLFRRGFDESQGFCGADIIFLVKVMIMLFNVAWQRRQSNR